VKRNRTFAAFTLIELLVVIAVIAILAALLLPALSGAKEEGYSTKCKSNLHQLTLAMAMYVQDTGTYPYYFPPGGWPGELQPYLKVKFAANISHNGNNNKTTLLGPQESVWACPTYNRLHGVFWIAGTSGDSSGAYGYNSAGLLDVTGGSSSLYSLGLGGGGDTDVTHPPTRENQVLVPSDMIAIGDAFLDTNGIWGDFLVGHTFLESVFESSYAYEPEIRGVPPGNPGFQAMRQRHWGKFNIGFCDAHVESLRTNELVNLKNSAVAARWNNDHQPHNYEWPQPW
jgi:prepilin-type N-terminal cleavage/methylation domain-containing protein/prepilin-type processing-associated H-X9-DG protein